MEAQKERKTGAGQTLTAVGSYWKGRKPLVLVRACILASLLPASDDPQRDLEMFEALMAMDIQSLSRRSPNVTAEMVVRGGAVRRDEWKPYIELNSTQADELQPETTEGAPGGNSTRYLKARWRRIDLSHITGADERRAERAYIEVERTRLKAATFAVLPFAEQVPICERVERVENIEISDDPLYAGVWEKVNARIGTTARNLVELVEQLGIGRFGHRPVIGDPFCGGGSIPFEARVGCDVIASDLNLVAAMLTWER